MFMNVSHKKSAVVFIGKGIGQVNAGSAMSRPVSVIADGAMIRTGPGAPPTHWYHVYYPIPQATAVSQGEKIRTTIRAMASVVNIEWRWKIEIFGADSSPSTDKPRATFEHFSEGYL